MATVPDLSGNSPFAVDSALPAHSRNLRGFTVTPVIAAIGESFIAQNHSTGYWSANGYINMAHAMGGCRFIWDRSLNFGVSGQNSTQIANRIGTALAANPDILIISAGSNDINSAIPFTTFQTNIIRMLRQCELKRVLPIIIPILPRGSGSWAAGAKIRQWQRMNLWLSSLPSLGYQCVVPDVLKYFMNLSDTSGRPLTGYVQADEVHLTGTGAYWIAKALNEVLNALIPPTNRLLHSLGDQYNAGDNPNGNLLPVMTGTAGQVNTGVTGTVFTGFEGTRLSGDGTAVASIVAADAATGAPAKQRFVITPGSTETEFAFTTDSTTWTVGAALAAQVAAFADIEVSDADDITTLYLELEDQSGAKPEHLAMYLASNARPFVDLGAGPVAFSLQGEPVVLAGSTGYKNRIRIAVPSTAGGTPTLDVISLGARLVS